MNVTLQGIIDVIICLTPIGLIWGVFWFLFHIGVLVRREPNEDDSGTDPWDGGGWGGDSD